MQYAYRYILIFYVYEKVWITVNTSLELISNVCLFVEAEEEKYLKMISTLLVIDLALFQAKTTWLIFKSIF